MLIRIEILKEKEDMEKGIILKELEDTIVLQFSSIVAIDDYFECKWYLSKAVKKITFVIGNNERFVFISKDQYDRLITLLKQVGHKKLFYDISK